MNTVEYECEQECDYWEAIHGVNGKNYKDEKYKKCSFCTRPIRERLKGHGIYASKMRDMVETNGILPSDKSL